MTNTNTQGNKQIKSFGSESLDNMVEKLRSTKDPKRRYEYVLWLAKKLPSITKEFLIESNKVKGCISEVYVIGEIKEGKISWKGYSDALITKGLLALLIKGLDQLTPEEVFNIDASFIEETGLNSSLTPSRANGFLNILLKMKAQAQSLSLKTSYTN
tara:strand:+ start:493 stop:963 length:471 start_codon:yes stop_codon:yes gene_type:complete